MAQDHVQWWVLVLMEFYLWVLLPELVTEKDKILVRWVVRIRGECNWPGIRSNGGF